MNLNIPFNYTNLKKIDLGLTNSNYIVDIDKKTYIARVPKDDLKHLFDRTQEAKVLEALKHSSFTLSPFYYEDGIQLVEYREHLINLNEYKNEDRMYRVSELMKEFHNSNVSVDVDFDPIQQCYIYEKYSKDLDINLEDYEIFFDTIRKIQYEPVLCHNDWVDGNICFIEDKTYLIDFEYAGNNDRRFDIMSFITENDLTREEKREFISHMYPYGLEHMEEVKLCMYRDLNNLLWYLWAKMMHTVRNEDIYDEIAKIKLKQLNEEFQRPLNF